MDDWMSWLGSWVGGAYLSVLRGSNNGCGALAH